MTERVQRLRRISVETPPYLTAERAELVTDFYASGVAERVSTPIARALCFQHLCENKAIYIGEGELIVGERGPAPKATPTYPELCCHSLDDLEIMHRRQRTRYRVDDAVRKVYAERIIPFWSGRTMREKVFGAMTPAWQRAFDAGVYTEFMEQRAPGHAILDDKIYHRGFADFARRIDERLAELDDLADLRAHDKREQLKAMRIVCDAIVTLAHRYADHAEQLAANEIDPVRRGELQTIAATCRHVPEHPPRSFREALQAYWFVHLGVITELNTWDSFNPGRLDQHLAPFYAQGLQDGSLTREAAEELVQCFWIKFNNQPAPPKVGITEEQSGTYTDFALINIGGVGPDGQDAVNDVSYLILDVVETMQLIQPSACIQLSKKNPQRFLRRACEVVRTGLGQPSMFNTDVILQEMLHDGKTYADARAGGPSGCVTISAFGKESCTLTGYCNLPKILEITMNGGVDPRTGVRVGLEALPATELRSHSDLFDAFKRQLRYFIDLKIAGNNVIERLYALHMPAPFMSVLMDDCIERGLDYHNGGPRYNPTYIQGVGLGTITDALSALRHHVYDRQTTTMDDLLRALACDFDGAEPLRQTLANKTPTYGNDDPVADEITRAVFEAYFDCLNGRPNTKGGRYRVNLLPTTVHIYFGQVTGALPNGRHAGEPLSDGISPSQGADRCGPTAVVKSAACIDHARTGGTLLNLKFCPQILEGEGLDRVADLVRGYFRLDGHHVQFNVVNAERLRAAQAEPQKYRDLIVRVAGYSDYFVDLGRDLQDEIIHRTEHESF